jgi:nucleoside-diphosphate-sugar epimerase
MAADDGRVVSNFIVQALRGEPLTIYGDGSQTRSFCYVDDLVSGLVGLMENTHQETGPVNIGNPGEFTMLELASQVLELTGSSSEIEHRYQPREEDNGLGATHSTERRTGQNHCLFLPTAQRLRSNAREDPFHHRYRHCSR